MAFASDSTTVPADHRALLIQRVCAAAEAGIGNTLDRMAESRIKPARDARGRFIKRSDLAVLSPADDADLDAAIGALFADIGIDSPELPPEPLLPVGVVPSEATPMGMLESEQPPMRLLTFEETSVGVPKSGDTPDAIDTASAARTLHLRRQLEAAAEHGVDLLAALGLPRLVGPDTIVVDPVAAGDALDLAIAALDAIDADPDLEDGGDDEATGDDELSLGWREAVSQLDLGHGQDDGEPTLGAPERHPYVVSPSASYFKPARGGRLIRRSDTREWNQTQWAAGSYLDGEGESEPGYDLPEGDDEKCGSEHDGCEPEENEAELGSPAGDGNQEYWAQGHDGETVNEDGNGETGPDANAPHPYARPISPRRLDRFGSRCADECRTIARRARDAKWRQGLNRLHDPDEVVPIGPGRALWYGPTHTRGGVPVVGTVGP